MRSAFIDQEQPQEHYNRGYNAQQNTDDCSGQSRFRCGILLHHRPTRWPLMMFISPMKGALRGAYDRSFSIGSQ
jgi:hypothetical protein